MDTTKIKKSDDNNSDKKFDAERYRITDPTQIKKVEENFKSLEKEGYDIKNEKPKDAKIDFEDFIKVDLRIGHIKSAERVEGSEKLMKLIVDLGEQEDRQILAGISKYYSPEELTDKKAIFVANLRPRKMMGLESNGMILAGHEKDADLLGLLSPDKDLSAGTRIG